LPLSESLPALLWTADFVCGPGFKVVLPFASLLFGVRFVFSREEEYAEESMLLSESRLTGHFLYGARLVAFFASYVLALPFGVCFFGIFCVLIVFGPTNCRAGSFGFPSLARSNDKISSVLATSFVLREVRSNSSLSSFFCEVVPLNQC
jgi:hypothetical protein